MKKLVCVFLASILYFSTSMQTTVLAKKRNTISLAIWESSPEESDLLQKVIYNFQRKYPHITVDLRVGKYQQNFPFIISEQMKHDRGPDVYYAHSYELSYYVNEEVIENLDPYISKSAAKVDTDDFFPNIYNKFQVTGSTYALPKGFTTFALYYNEEMLKKQKVKPPKTFEEFEKAAISLTNKEGQYGFGINSDLPLFFLPEEVSDEKIVHRGRATFASDEMVKGVETLNDMIQQDKSIAIATITGYEKVWEAFAHKSFAMMVEGLYVVPYLRSHAQGIPWKVAPVPEVNGKKNTRIDTVGYAMNPQSKNKDAAWLLIEYLTSKEGMDEWTSKGLEMPARKSVFEKQKWNEKKEYKAFVDSIENAEFFPNDKYSPIIRSRFNQSIGNFFYGLKEPKQALKEGQDRANHYIELMEKTKEKAKNKKNKEKRTGNQKGRE